MKINGTCRNCKRDFPIDLALSVDNPGRCPFCGKPLDTDYGAMLVESLVSLQRLGTNMVTLLEKTRSVGENLDLDAESIIEPLRKALEIRAHETEQRRATRAASETEGHAATH